MSPASLCQVNIKHDSLVAVLEEILKKANANDPAQSTTSKEPSDAKPRRRAATILLICMTREDLLAQLASEIHHSRSQPQPQPQTQETPAYTKWQTPSLPSPHPLLIPLLSTLHSARSITLVFTPTIPMFRAYTATISFGAQAATRWDTARVTDSASDDTDLVPPEAGRRSRPSVDVVVVNMVAMHRGTSQFTLQGLGRSFSGVAEAVGRANEFAERVCRVGVDGEVEEGRRARWPEYRAVLAECRDPRTSLLRGDDGVGEGEREAGRQKEEGGDGEVHEGAAEVQDGTGTETQYEGRGIWDTPVSLLSGSVRMGTGAWSGRQVSVRKVAERWFEFADE